MCNNHEKVSSNVIYFKTTADMENTGEVLIYKSLLELLRRKGQVVVADNKEIYNYFLNQLGVRENERLTNNSRFGFGISVWKSAFSCLFAKKNVFLITGIGAHTVKGNKAVIKNIVSAVYCVGLRILGVRLIRIGMSMQISGKLASLSEKILSSTFNHYFVRDSISLRNCQSAGIKKVKLAPDLSWSYPIKDKVNGLDENRIVLSFRDYAGTKDCIEKYKKQLLDSIINIVEELSRNNSNVIFNLTHQVNNDLSFMKEIDILLKQRNIKVKLVQEFITIENAENYYAKTKLIFSNRLHVLLLAYKFGALPIALTDLNQHLKIKGIFEDSDLHELLFDINSKQNDTYNHLNNVIESRERLLLKIKNVEKENCHYFENIMNEIMQ